MRENKTRYAILGMLSRREMSGYDIKKALDMGMRAFWNESNGQIYPIIKELAAEGLAEKTVERQEGKPDRHVYAITASGREELRRWLESPAEAPKYRLEFLLKLIFGHETTDEVNIGHLDVLRKQQMEQLHEFKEVEQCLLEVAKHDSRTDYGLLTLRCGMRVTQALSDWADEEIALLNRSKPSDERKETDE